MYILSAVLCTTLFLYAVTHHTAVGMMRTPTGVPAPEMERVW